MTFVRWFVKNIGTLLLALILAVAVWVSAVTAADPDETRTLDTLVSLEFVGQDPSLIITSTIPQGVEVTLRAPSSIWNILESQSSPVRASLDLTSLDTGEHNVPIQVQIATQPVRVIALSPAVVKVVLEPLGTRTLPVELFLNGELAIGYEAREPVLDPNTITITGPEALVNRVTSVIASLDISGARESIELPLTIIPVDAGGDHITGLTITPDSVDLSLEISQQGGYRDLVVKLVLVGRVENGYRLASLAVLPPVVTVYSADTELINSLPAYVETIALNLDGLSADFETNLQLNLPPGVTIVGQQTVLIQVDITAIEGSINLSDRPVEVAGLRTGLKAQISPEIVDIILSGPLPILNTLSAADVRVFVDVSGLGPGTYQLTPEVDIVIEGIKVESFLPASVEVVIK